MINLQSIRQKIEGESEDARFIAWMELYGSDEKPAEAEINRIINGNDPILKILFCRFLSSAPEDRAADFLVRLLNDQNETVIENAIKAFDKNKLNNKTRKIIPILSAPTLKAQYFAIDRLTSAGVLLATEHLLRKMADAPETMLKAILSGFRFLNDKRVLYDVLPLTNDTREAIRFHALLATAALYESGQRQLHKFIISHLDDPSVEIRRLIVWTLRKKSLRK
ncbi:MAG: hypothetical protein HQM16_15960, partial [Deltaproteobacteria bacterium]|nr:hypothetical protein [Deltaproteobacteria bacterium]